MDDLLSGDLRLWSGFRSFDVRSVAHETFGRAVNVAFSAFVSSLFISQLAKTVMYGRESLSS